MPRLPEASAYSQARHGELPLTVPVLLAIARLISRVGWQVAGLLMAQRRAKAGFRQGLREAGLSPQDVERLAPLFPILSPTQFIPTRD